MFSFINFGVVFSLTSLNVTHSCLHFNEIKNKVSAKAADLKRHSERQC